MHTTASPEHFRAQTFIAALFSVKSEMKVKEDNLITFACLEAPVHR